MNDAGDHPVALRDGRQVGLGEFRRHVRAIARRLPAGPSTSKSMINLCEDRYRFLASYAAALGAGHTVLMPPARAEQVVGEVQNANPGSYRWDDAAVETALRLTRAADAERVVPATPAASRPGALAVSERYPAGSIVQIDLPVPDDHVAMMAFTSGSTGQPTSYPKPWRSVSASTARNAAAIRAALGLAPAAMPWILATVPPQHMYGMELSILLPLIGGMAVHAGRPLFPADIAQALDELPAPRVLVSTPVHLRAIVESEQPFPATDLIISATAPLERALAAAVEATLGGRLLELFGSTETCVFARRRTAVETSWTLYEGVQLEPRPEGTLVHAPWFAEPILLQDIVELQGAGQFLVRGRNTDMIEVAGKRASLADLTRRLLAIEGVEDAVVFQPETDSAAVRRLAALVVAPRLNARQVLERLAPGVDPAFLPRPLLIVDALPRNELGKLPRERLMQALR